MPEQFADQVKVAETLETIGELEGRGHLEERGKQTTNEWVFVWGVKGAVWSETKEEEKRSSYVLFMDAVLTVSPELVRTAFDRLQGAMYCSCRLRAAID